MKFKVIGNSLFLTENETLENSLISNIEIDLNSWGADPDTPWSVYCVVCELSRGFPPYIENYGYEELGYDSCEDVWIYSSKKLKKDKDYMISVYLTYEEGYPIWAASGRFSVVKNVVCYKPEIIELEFDALKNALIEVADKYRKLEAEYGAVREILKGYTTE